MSRSGRDIQARIDAAQAMYFPSASGGGGTPTNFIKVPFTYLSGAQTLAEVFPGSVIDGAGVIITTALDGINPSVIFGTTTSPSLILGATDSFPRVIDQYAAQAVVNQPIHDFLRLQVTAPGATHGAGILYYRLKQ
jgi:hypothetical protein